MVLSGPIEEKHGEKINQLVFYHFACPHTFHHTGYRGHFRQYSGGPGLYPHYPDLLDRAWSVPFNYGRDHIGYWLQKPKGHWIWLSIAGLVSLSTLPLFLQHYDVMRNLTVLIPSIIFFLINPWLEEFYWRGLLIDVTNKWPAWVSIGYSSILFTLWHTAFAWYSTGVRSLSFYLPVLILGLVMGMIYKNTKSLWPAILSQMLINALNLSIPVLMNIIEF